MNIYYQIVIQSLKKNLGGGVNVIRTNLFGFFIPLKHKTIFVLAFNNNIFTQNNLTNRG